MKSLLAVIREEDCIGCAKCIEACPFDAIIGSAKFMHTVISDECVGCELCIEPCPVDCIDLVPTIFYPKELRLQRATKAKKRYQARQKRLIKKNETPASSVEKIQDKKSYITAALLRKKLQEV